MSALPESRRVQTNGIELSVHEAGSGFPVVFCHGFPELAYSWRHQLPALARAGFRAIAPDQRGYGRSDRPSAVESYDIWHLTEYMAGLLDALELERAVFCGHDWGGLVVWQMALLHPERVAGVIGLNTPFMPRGPARPIEMLRAAFGEGHYIVYFQKPGMADARLAADVRRTFQMFMRCGAKLVDLEAEAEAEGQGGFEDWLGRDDWPGRLLLDDVDLDVFVRAFERSGFTSGINWYRNMDRNWETTADVPREVRVPGLMISAEDDGALPPALSSGMEQFVPDLERHLIRDCGHWTQQEHPEDVNRIIVDWLERRFAA